MKLFKGNQEPPYCYSCGFVIALLSPQECFLIPQTSTLLALPPS